MKASFAKNEGELAKRISAYLKARARDAGVTYTELADRMKKHGHPHETEESVKAKLKRGTFPATYLVAAVAALGLSIISLKDI